MLICRLILFHFTCLCSLLQSNWKMPIKMAHGKMADFVSFTLFGFTLVIKLGNFHFGSHWNAQSFLIKKDNDVRFQYVLSNSVWCGYFLIKESFVRSNVVPALFLHFFRHYHRYSFELKNIPMILEYIGML